MGLLLSPLGVADESMSRMPVKGHGNGGGRLAGAGVKGGNGGVNLRRNSGGTSLVVQWLRIRLPIQETWVQSLVQEDPISPGTATTESMSPRAQALRQESSPHAPQVEKTHVQQGRPSAPKNKYINK